MTFLFKPVDKISPTTNVNGKFVVYQSCWINTSSKLCLLLSQGALKKRKLEPKKAMEVFKFRPNKAWPFRVYLISYIQFYFPLCSSHTKQLIFCPLIRLFHFETCPFYLIWQNVKCFCVALIIFDCSRSKCNRYKFYIFCTSQKGEIKWNIKESLKVNLLLMLLEFESTLKNKERDPQA